MNPGRQIAEFCLGGLLALNLAAMFFGVAAPFIASAAVSGPAALYALLCALSSPWWLRRIAARPHGIILQGPPFGLYVGIVGGSFVISFLGAETGIAAICTRLAGVAETRELVVKESVWIGHRKWGADQCYQVELRGYSDMTAHPDRLCYAKPVESGTTIRITGWHSMLGSWYVDIDPAPDGPPPPRP